MAFGVHRSVSSAARASPEPASRAQRSERFRDTQASQSDAGTLVSPDGAAGLQSVLAKLHTLITSWPGYTEDQLRGIRAPTLLAMGDRDFITAEHFARMASLIPNAHYAVLPGTTHMTILQRGDWLEPMMAARFSA